VDFEALGAIHSNDTFEVAFQNGQLFNDTVNALQPGETFLIPGNRTFYLIGGIKADGMKDVVWQMDGNITFLNDRSLWPVNDTGSVEECILLTNIENVLFTSKSRKGVLDGNGKKWWGMIDYLIHQEDRPRLMHIITSKNVTVEYWFFKDSPFWTFYAQNSDGLIIRYSKFEARWTDQETHTWYDKQALNTDGIDVTGRNVHIHDVDIWVQDDCIAVKDGSRDMLIERVSCSGIGLVIGSIGSSIVQNITFRDSVMPHTWKGIYLKTRWYDSAPIGPAASISDILYENITITDPEQYAIWIGPAQQAGQPCSFYWYRLPGYEPGVHPKGDCKMTAYQTWSNIVLKDIYITNSKLSPGVLFGNGTNPMQGIVFDNVVVSNPGNFPFDKDLYYCEGMTGIAKGKTNPIPPCFKYVP